MRILLVQPNGTEGVKKKYVSLQFPINLGYLAAVLKKEGHVVKMVDFNITDPSMLSVYINRFKPDVVGITSFTATIENAKKIVQATRRINPGLVIVLGGVHASALPMETMQSIEELDYLVYGEGEETIRELLQVIEYELDPRTVKGIIYRTKKSIIKNAPRPLITDLDTIPFPDRDLIPMRFYTKQHVSRGFSRAELNIIEILTSRGCPNNCIFCSSHINYGRTLRFRSYENIIAEMNECMEKYGTNHFSIEDDTFTINKELVRKLCEFFIEHKLTWNCNTRVNTVDYELLRRMARAGCKKVAFGVESGNPEMLKKIKKGITIQQVEQAVRAAKKAGIRYVECDFMIGAHVDETKEDVQDTVNLIYRLMPDFVMVSIMCPYPGTEIHNLMVERNFFPKDVQWSNFSFYGNLERYERITHMTTPEMALLQHKILKDYYGSAKYIISQLKQIRDFKEIRYFFRMGILYLQELLFKNTSTTTHSDS
jgi:anaerobic magnesium-protoporphyrin IX monomethyl ester cyclase